MSKIIQLFSDSIQSCAVRIKDATFNKLNDESGVGVIEVILILLVLVGLVIIFKNQITSLARSIFSNISSQVDGV